MSSFLMPVEMYESLQSAETGQPLTDFFPDGIWFSIDSQENIILIKEPGNPTPEEESKHYEAMEQKLVEEGKLTKHSESCWASPQCVVCGRTKKPKGRDAGIAAANGYCDYSCPGYTQGEQPGHFWPGEEAYD